jgi:hypothetical protein
LGPVTVERGIAPPAATGGSSDKLNDALILAQGEAVSGASYSFVDRSGYGTFRYLLEDVNYYGVNTLHGPIDVQVRP